jgi:hypothetical protein
MSETTNRGATAEAATPASQEQLREAAHTLEQFARAAYAEADTDDRDQEQRNAQLGILCHLATRVVTAAATITGGDLLDSDVWSFAIVAAAVFDAEGDSWADGDELAGALRAIAGPKTDR